MITTVLIAAGSIEAIVLAFLARFAYVNMRRHDVRPAPAADRWIEFERQFETYSAEAARQREETAAPADDRDLVLAQLRDRPRPKP